MKLGTCITVMAANLALLAASETAIIDFTAPAGPVKDVNGIPFLAAAVDHVDATELRHLCDSFRDQLGECVILLVSASDQKVSLVAAATDGAVKRGAHAGNLIKAVAGFVGGGGGGRPNMAQAGGKDPSGIPAALAKAEEVLKEQIK